MATTVKRLSICLTKETNRQLLDLLQEYGETITQIVSRSIDLLHKSHERKPK